MTAPGPSGRVVAIIQARMTSTRLPGKILMPLGGRPMLAQQLRRVRTARRLDEIVIATTVNSTDDPVVELARAEGAPWHRGSEADVLGRYLGAARQHAATVVVRLTADCPLSDGAEIDRVVDALLTEPADYASNVLERTLPRGLDAEALHADVLERVARLASSQPAREHVTAYIVRERPDLFVRRGVVSPTRAADLRWTVDTLDDFRAVERIFEGMALGDKSAPYPEILAYVRAHPEITAINSHIEQKP